MSRDAARVVFLAESFASEEVSSDEELPGHSNMWCQLLEAVYHHSIGGFLAMSMCHSGQGSAVAVVPLRALCERSGALVHRPVPHVMRRAP